MSGEPDCQTASEILAKLASSGYRGDILGHTAARILLGLGGLTQSPVTFTKDFPKKLVEELAAGRRHLEQKPSPSKEDILDLSRLAWLHDDLRRRFGTSAEFQISCRTERLEEVPPLTIPDIPLSMAPFSPPKAGEASRLLRRHGIDAEGDESGFLGGRSLLLGDRSDSRLLVVLHLVPNESANLTSLVHTLKRWSESGLRQMATLYYGRGKISGQNLQGNLAERFQAIRQSTRDPETLWRDLQRGKMKPTKTEMAQYYQFVMQQRDPKIEVFGIDDPELIHLQQRFMGYLHGASSPYLRRYFLMRGFKLAGLRTQGILEALKDATPSEGGALTIQILTGPGLDLLTLIDALKHSDLSYLVVEAK